MKGFDEQYLTCSEEDHVDDNTTCSKQSTELAPKATSA